MSSTCRVARRSSERSQANWPPVQAKAAGAPAPGARPKGTLFVVSTPIGNLSDVTQRAGDVLRSVARVLAEDTRRARTLLDRLGATVRPASLHAHNEAGRSKQALAWLAAGQDVALVSDAGTPLLSDPGERLVAAAVAAGCAVSPVPGPSAALAALVASGLPVAPFTFVGFLPRKGAARRAALASLASVRETSVLFESPRRLAGLLADVADVAGADRRVAVCRELTKVHEEIVRGAAGDCAARFSESPPRGEVTLVVEGRPATARQRQAGAEARALATSLLEAGLPPGVAAKVVARHASTTRAAAYEAVRDAGPAGP